MVVDIFQLVQCPHVESTHKGWEQVHVSTCRLQNIYYTYRLQNVDVCLDARIMILGALSVAQ